MSNPWCHCRPPGNRMMTLPSLRERARGRKILASTLLSAGVAQALHDMRVVGNYLVAVRLRAPCRLDVFGGEQIFGAPRDAVQRSANFSGGHFFVRFGGLLQRQIFGERDDAQQAGSIALEAIEVHFRDRGGGDFPRADRSEEHTSELQS